MTYLLLEFGLSNMAPILFMITAVVNFYQIRSIGFNRIVQFSPLFKVKIFASRLMIVLNFAISIAALFAIELWDATENVKTCGTEHNWPEFLQRNFKYFNLLKLVKAVGWYFSVKLLIYQYRKGLSEQWYCHKLFWIISFTCDILTFVYSIQNNHYEDLMIGINGF